jgi:glycosyltransferase involved in cell wall biosynthesis
MIDGTTGFLCAPRDAAAIAAAIERYFASDLYRNLESRRQQIRDYAQERHSWDIVGEMTRNVYAGLGR